MKHFFGKHTSALHLRSRMCLYAYMYIHTVHTDTHIDYRLASMFIIVDDYM